MEIFLRYTHATEIKFNTHVLCTLSFEFVKKMLYLSSRVWKTNFFLAPCIGRRGSQTRRSTWRVSAWCTCLNVFVLTYTSVRRIFFSFWGFFFNFWFLWKEKKIRFPYSRTQIQNFFFTNSRVNYACVLNFISVTCVERIKDSNFL